MKKTQLVLGLVVLGLSRAAFAGALEMHLQSLASGVKGSATASSKMKIDPSKVAGEAKGDSARRHGSGHVAEVAIAAASGDIKASQYIEGHVSEVPFFDGGPLVNSKNVKVHITKVTSPK